MIQQLHFDKGWKASQDGDARAADDALLELPPHQYHEFERGFDAAQNATEFA